MRRTDGCRERTQAAHMESTNVLAASNQPFLVDALHVGPSLHVIAILEADVVRQRSRKRGKRGIGHHQMRRQGIVLRKLPDGGSQDT